MISNPKISYDYEDTLFIHTYYCVSMYLSNPSTTGIIRNKDKRTHIALQFNQCCGRIDEFALFPGAIT